MIRSSSLENGDSPNALEEELHRVRAELDSLYEGTIAGILAVDCETRRFVRANRVMGNLLGYSKEELLALTVPDIHPADQLPEVMIIFEAMRSGRLQSSRNVPFLRKDGQTIYLDVGMNLFESMGRPLMVGFFHDVSENRKAELALLESESKLRNLFTHLPDLVFTLDRDAVIRFANRGVPSAGLDDLLNVCIYNFIVPEQRRQCRDVMDRAFLTGMPQNNEALDIFGSWWSSRVVSLSMDGHPDHAMVIATDITQERLAKEAVDKEQRLLRRLLDLHERERRVMAYDIHDGFAQQLTGAMFRMQGFRDMLQRNPDKAWEDFETALRLLGRSIDETRRLISGLRPPILDESGIVDAVEYLVCEQSKQTGIEIEFQHDRDWHRLAPPLESALFRIVQETLQNACRHSRTDRVRIELSKNGSMIRLDIRDWGIGFCPDRVEGRHFGLQGIRERARLLNGHVEIDSISGQGTHIAVELPLIAPWED